MGDREGAALGFNVWGSKEIGLKHVGVHGSRHDSQFEGLGGSWVGGWVGVGWGVPGVRVDDSKRCW